MSTKRKAHTALDEVDEDGNFKRTAAGFSHTIMPGDRFPPEAGRYRLYIALGCPWANGCLTALHLKGLQEAIAVSVVHPTWRRTRPDDPDDDHTGWHFRAPGDAPVTNESGHGSFECDDALAPDAANGCRTVRELYEMAGDTTGKYTTPVLWCEREKTIVCNESMDILRIFNNAFNGAHLALNPGVDLFPSATASEAQSLNEFIYPQVNNGVYRCGFARTQPAYERASDELFGALARLEELFAARRAASKGPFLTGDGRAFTWIDLRLYHTLVRFDPVYVTYFKTNRRRIADSPELLAFLRAAHAVPAVRDTTNIRHIKMHYFSSHPTLNLYGVIPAYDGPDLEQPGSKAE
eukprot:g3246.t1